jgi:TetR/AcrR family transcriptional regulator
MEEHNGIEEQILETARHVFANKGYEATNMSDIAAEAGISRTSLHYYFHTKDRIFEAVSDRVVQSFLPRMQSISEENTDFLEKLDKIIDQYMLLLIENPALPKFVVEEIQRDVDHLLEIIRKAFPVNSILLSLKSQLEKEMEEGKLKKMPVEVVVSTFFSLLVFPFLTKNLLMVLFFDGREDHFQSYLTERKKTILQVMKDLLT